jgi:hypothetical protein
MKLVPGARRAWRWFSMQAMAGSVALQGAWLALPADMKGALPETVVMWATIGLLVAGAIGRLVDQGGSDGAV